MTSRRRTILISALAGVLAVSLGSFALWRWGPFGSSPEVPSCSEVTRILTGAVEGSWTLTGSRPNREVTRSVIGCEFEFQSADQSYRGRITLDLSGSDDAAHLREKAETGPCYGESVVNPSAGRYRVARSCLERINDKAFAGVFVASEDRYAHALAEFSSPSLPSEQVIAYAKTTTQHIVDQAMTLGAGD